MNVDEETIRGTTGRRNAIYFLCQGPFFQERLGRGIVGRKGYIFLFSFSFLALLRDIVFKISALASLKNSFLSLVGSSGLFRFCVNNSNFSTGLFFFFPRRGPREMLCLVSRSLFPAREIV